MSENYEFRDKVFNHIQQGEIK